jgi:hypothetical protein
MNTLMAQDKISQSPVSQSAKYRFSSMQQLFPQHKFRQVETRKLYSLKGSFRKQFLADYSKAISDEWQEAHDG